jgi:putative SOS response-associated peptidase YedK
VCGRFALHHPNDEVHERFAVLRPTFLTEPRYNIAPTQVVSVVTPARERVAMRWGLVPRWSKDGKPFINARAETIAEKPSFRSALASRRVLVPASGFYEWRTEGKLKRPVHIRMRGGGLFAMAGVWEPPLDPGGLPTLALITVAANTPMRSVHDRMPAILRRDTEEAWLASANEAPQALLLPYDDDAIELIPVSSRVNGVRDDDAGLLEPERHGLFG